MAVACPLCEPAFVGCSDIATTLVSALWRNVSTSQRALTVALTIGGGFGRSQAVEKANEFVISGFFRDARQVCKTSTPGSNPGGASTLT
jgi:hypothetical protein